MDGLELPGVERAARAEAESVVVLVDTVKVKSMVRENRNQNDYMPVSGVASRHTN